ncbi:uncharacterized protein LOC111005824 [Momordica charantia]|uniref:Uncharacterized protein LOC111005824 n=1 Tax=Momordica charantia TaxID=3673 RepID=A0A6J1BY95_MOMCH|nr:uncharacterized protein LOC111005824 [Momordica charantia]
MASTGSFSRPRIVSPTTLLFGSASLRSKNQVRILRAHLSEDEESLIFKAKKAASLRFIESRQPNPLFVDQYAGCLVSPQLKIQQFSHHYCVATKFIDDKLLQIVHHVNGLEQVVLLTDGMDTRPYRLHWPMWTRIIDISPDIVFKRANQDLQVNGAKIPKGNSFYHVPLESQDIQQELCTKGFRGDRPSVWAMQGLPIKTLVEFGDVLSIVSNMAMKGSFFLGEFPSWLTDTNITSKSSTSMAKWIDKFFMENGFRVETVDLEKVATRLGKKMLPGPYKNIPFFAEQLRFSDKRDGELEEGM